MLIFHSYVKLEGKYCIRLAAGIIPFVTAKGHDLKQVCQPEVPVSKRIFLWFRVVIAKSARHVDE